MRWPLASLRTYLHVITLAAVLPLALLTVWLVSRQVGLAKDQLSMRLQQGANSFALMIEREQLLTQEALQALANTQALQHNDLQTVHRTLNAFMAVRPGWERISLIDLAHGTVLSTGSADDLAEPGDLVKQLSQASAPGFSGLLPGLRPGEWRTRIVVPVVQNGKARYLLVAYIPQDYWQKLISAASRQQGRFITLYDRTHTIIARTLNPQEHVGRPLAHPMAVERVSTLVDTQGFRKIHIPDQGDAYVSWQRVPISEWGVRVGVESADLDHANWMALVAAAGAGLLSLSVGLILSRVISTRINKPLSILAQSGASGLMDKDLTVFEIAMLRNAMLGAEEQRDLARQSLLSKASEFETLFMLSPIGLSITLDTACEAVRRNPAKIALFDMGPDGAQDYDVVVNGRVIPPSDYPLQRAARGEHISALKMDVHHHDGRILRILAHAVPLLNEQGQPRGAIATFVDITEQIQSQTKLMLAQSRLEDNQQFVELAQKAGDVGFFDHAVAANRITMTSGLSLLSGLGDSEVVTTWEGWLSHLDPLDGDAIQAHVAQAWEARRDQVTFKLQLHGAPGRARWLSCRAVCMYDPDGHPARMIGAVVDVTAQQEIEQERSYLMAQEQAARQEAEQANRAKDEFLAVLGHELRNPLGAISAGMEVLNRISTQGDQPARVRMIITRQTRHLARLMDDLLDVARIIAGKIHLSLAPVNLQATVQRLVNTFKIAGLEQEVNIDVDNVWVQADTVRLDQIINNLITNASKYSPPDTPIHIIGKHHGDKVRLQVINHGQGIPATLLPHIFDLFVQGERTIERRQGGLGIGLTLVKSLVDLHHGHIEARSEDDSNIFTVDLPAAEADARQTADSHPVVTTGRKVLIIEDNDDARETVRMMLEIKGHEVEARADSEGGLQALLELRPHLALVDIGLPGLSGYEVARRAREGGYEGWMVALSGYGQQKDVQRALASGFDFHMVKPLDEDILDEYLSRP